MKRNPYKQKFMASMAKGNILDCGCSWNPNPFLKNAVGIDIEKCNIPKNYSKIVVSDLNKDLPFKKDSFDSILAGDVVEHLYNPFGFLAECKRVLKKKGKLIISVPNKWIYPLHDDTPFHINHWSPKNFKRLLNHYFNVKNSYGSSFKIFGFKINLKKLPHLSHIAIFECEK